MIMSFENNVRILSAILIPLVFESEQSIAHRYRRHQLPIPHSLATNQTNNRRK